MTGFIRGIFNRKAADESAAAQPAKAPKEDQAFFLDPDEAKSFGDIEYMRTPKVIKRTFPKTLSNTSEVPRIEQVSALESARAQEIPGSGGAVEFVQKVAAPNPTPSVTETPASRAETESRRSQDSSMDMFRNMARDMKRHS